MLTVKKYIKEALTAITALGSAYFYGILIIFLFLLNKNKTALYIIIGLIICYSFVFILRIFYFKERPNKEDYFNLFTKINASSFPSLHTLSSTYVATVLSNSLMNTKLTIFFYTIVLFIASSRIYLKKHYLFDVFAGLIIGIIASAIYLYLT